MENLKNKILNFKEKLIKRSNNLQNYNKEKKDKTFFKPTESIFSIENLITLLFLIFLIGGIYLFTHIVIGDSGDDTNTTDNIGAVAVESSTDISSEPIDEVITSKRITTSHLCASLREVPIKNNHPKKELDLSIEEYLPELPDMPDISKLMTYEGEVETVKAVVDKKSYKQSDLLIIGDTKIWFGRNSIKLNEDELCIKAKNKLICRLEGIDVPNIRIVRQLTKQKIGKIRIGRHKKETWIVISPNSSYSNNFEIREVSGREYEEEIVFHKKYHTTNRRVSPPAETHTRATSTSLSQSKVKQWNDADGLYLDNEFIATFKEDRVTLERGSCNMENGKWICTIPNKKVQWEDITQKIKHLNAIESVKLNLDSRTKQDARVIITLKPWYRAVKRIVNGKEILIFEGNRG